MQRLVALVFGVGVFGVFATALLAVRPQDELRPLARLADQRVEAVAAARGGGQRIRWRSLRFDSRTFQELDRLVSASLRKPGWKRRIRLQGGEIAYVAYFRSEPQGLAEVVVTPPRGSLGGVVVTDVHPTSKMEDLWLWLEALPRRASRGKA